MMSKQPALQLSPHKIVPPDAQAKTLPPPKRDPNAPSKTRDKLTAEVEVLDSVSKSKRGNFIGRAWAALVSKPDHSPEGLDMAIRAALKVCEEIDYVSADHMCEEIEHEISERLNAREGVYVEYIGAHKKDRRPRILIVTDWGLRRAVFTLIGFSMVHAPERRRER